MATARISTTLNVDDSQLATAVVTANGNVDTSTVASWTVTDPTVVGLVVDSGDVTGRSATLTGLKAGITTVSVQCGSVGIVFDVTVNANTIAVSFAAA